MMKLSEKDKKLLFILGIIALLFLPYYFVIRPYSENTLALEEESGRLESRKRQLQELEIRREEFEKGLETAGQEREELLSRFPSELPEEGSLLFLYNTEKLIPITLSQVTLGDEVRMPIAEDVNPEAVQTDASDGETDAADTVVGTEITEALTGMHMETQILYSGGYKNFKDFLNYILHYKDRMVISGLSAIYSGDLDMVTGNLILKQYAVAGEGRRPVRVRKPSIAEGSSNVFMQASGILPEAESGNAESDFFLMLSQPEAEVEAVIFGKSMDGSGQTYLTSKENSLQETAISFKGEDGSYIANYQIGDVKFSKSGSGVAFDKEGNITVEVTSSPRVGTNDNVGVRLEIINKTDKIVYVAVKNDDKENPRVTITGKTGEVIVR